ncbi:MAG TPA: Txe/YoeB family addiction module toxin [Acidobacteria bacterium]|nr:Txe/YoeB family addiction module toxin [Acidobacteriota bacterium]
MKKIAFERRAFEDFTDWATTDRQTHKRIVALIADILREPFSGLGKPEPLRHEMQGYWSRRIDQEHRLVYRVDPDAVTIIACKYHY